MHSPVFAYHFSQSLLPWRRAAPTLCSGSALAQNLVSAWRNRLPPPSKPLIIDKSRRTTARSANGEAELSHGRHPSGTEDISGAGGEVRLRSIPREGARSFPAGDAAAQLKVAIHTRLRVVFVVYEVEAQSETCTGLHISAPLSSRAPLARSASAPALSDASRAALIDCAAAAPGVLNTILRALKHPLRAKIRGKDPPKPPLLPSQPVAGTAADGAAVQMKDTGNAPPCCRLSAKCPSCQCLAPDESAHFV